MEGWVASWSPPRTPGTRGGGVPEKTVGLAQGPRRRPAGARGIHRSLRGAPRGFAAFEGLPSAAGRAAWASAERRRPRSGVPVDEPANEAPQEELARGGPGAEPEPQVALRGEAIPLLAHSRVLLLESRVQLRHQ